MKYRVDNLWAIIPTSVGDNLFKFSKDSQKIFRMKRHNTYNYNQQTLIPVILTIDYIQYTAIHSIQSKVLLF